MKKNSKLSNSSRKKWSAQRWARFYSAESTINNGSSKKKVSIMQSDDKREKLVDDESNSELNGWVENTKRKILASSAPGFCIFIHSLGCRPKREKKYVCACINAIFIFFMFAGPKEHRKSKKQQQQPVTTRYVCCAYFYCVFILGGRMGRKKSWTEVEKYKRGKKGEKKSRS